VNLGPTELLIILVWLIPLALTLYARVDAARKPMRAYEAAGVSKSLWVVLLAVSLIIPCGMVLVLWWLISTGPKVNRQAQIGGIGFPGR
jgi:hypothetical protein